MPQRPAPPALAGPGGECGDVVDGDLFRAVMSSACMPVVVVTAVVDERPHGTTVSSFASLSLAPPMVLVALDRTSDLLAVLRGSGRFGVNLLSVPQDRIAVAFARKGGDKFAGVAWRLDDGLPRIDDGAGWLSCRMTKLVQGGDHYIAMGTVSSAAHSPLAPLTYHRRRFGTAVALDLVSE